jgi:hypothetical protein
METLKQFGDKHVSMDTHGQQYNTTIYNINFELGHTTKRRPACKADNLTAICQPIVQKIWEP